mgnify:FL=1
MIEQVKRLCALDGVSGHEQEICRYLCEQLAASPAEMEVVCDPLGNLLARVKGKRRAEKQVMFAAHMDEVGLIITGITPEGFLRFTTVGGIDPAVLYGHRVRVNGCSGVIGGKAVHMCTAEEKTRLPEISHMLIDIGAENEAAAAELVSPGDVAAFDGAFRELPGDLLQAKALDDRAGCALLLELVRSVPECDITLAFTVQEEIGLRGAKTAAFAIKPDIAVVVDATTAADIAGVKGDKRVCCIGSGPVVSFMDKRTLYDKPLYDWIRCQAEEEGIPAQTKSLVAGGNDAGAIQLAGSGARVAAVSLPCRYLHSPACVLSRADMWHTAALLQVLAARLPL